MIQPKRLWLVVVAAALFASCGDATPSRPATSAGPSATARAGTSAPNASPTPVRQSQQPTPSATPPYRFAIDDPGPAQEAGTILFGALSGPVSDGVIEPFRTWPEGGMTYEAPISFGAFWGSPVGASQIRITLYRVRGGTLDRVWSDVKRVDASATGFLDRLVPFKGPGTYRLEVTRDSELLAWGTAHLGPKCETNCSGG